MLYIHITVGTQAHAAGRGISLKQIGLSARSQLRAILTVCPAHSSKHPPQTPTVELRA